MPSPLPASAQPTISLIAAVACNGALGKDNRLLVHLPGDLPRFKRITFGHPIVMGRKTFDSIGRALPGRQNIVITRNTAWSADGVERAGSFAEALNRAGAVPQLYVTGGADIYALALPHADELLLTEIDANYDADAFFPDWPRDEFSLVDSESNTTPLGLTYRYATYRRKAMAGAG